MHQSEALVYGRTKPDRQITEINVCGIDFAPEWQPIHDVDAATVARLAADVNIEISLQYPGGLPFVLEKLAAADALLAYIPILEAAMNAQQADIAAKYEQVMALATGVAGSLNGVPVGLEVPEAVRATTLRVIGNETGTNYSDGTALFGDDVVGGRVLAFGNNAAGEYSYIQAVKIGHQYNELALNKDGGKVTTGGDLSAAGGLSGSGLNVRYGGFYNAANKFGVDNYLGMTRFYSSGPDSITRGIYDFRLTDSVGGMDLSGMSLSQDHLCVPRDLIVGGNLLAGATSGNHHKLIKNNPNDLVLAVVNSSTASPYGANIAFTGAAPADGSTYFLLCSDTVGPRMQILASGNVQNVNNSYGGISDIKHKEHITDTSAKLPKMMLVRIVDYYLKSQPGQKLCGVIAQELEKIWPGLVEESPDYEDVEISPARTEIKITKKQSVEFRDEIRYEIVEVDGQWTKLPIRTTVEVPLFTEHLLYAEDGSSVMECVTPAVDAVVDADGNLITPAQSAVYQQAIHRVPVTEDISEVVEIPEVIERRATGTVTKSVKYSVFVPLLIKAMQEQQVIIDEQGSRLSELDTRLAALEAA